MKEITLSIWNIAKNNRIAALGTIIIILLSLAAIFAPWITPYPLDASSAVHPSQSFLPPSPTHWFGTDSLGKDLFTLVIFGGQISIFSSIIAIIVALIIGIPLGLIAGYAGGWIDEVIMRFTDIVLSFPSLLLAVAISSLLGPSLINAIAAIALSWWPWYTRLIRSQVIILRTAGYVESATIAGQSSWSIMLSHVLPNAVTPIIIQSSMDLGGVILTLAGLGFLGMGAQPPSPEWGLLVSQGREYILSDWWYITFPGIAIILAAASFNLMGDGLRDHLDPRVKGLNQ